MYANWVLKSSHKADIEVKMPQPRIPSHSHISHEQILYFKKFRPQIE